MRKIFQLINVIFLFTTYYVVAVFGVLYLTDIIVSSAFVDVFIDTTCNIWASFTYFCEKNHYCPWLMVFGGRAADVIAGEMSSHAIKLASASSYDIFIFHVSKLLLCLSELTLGPIIGILLFFIQGVSIFYIYNLITSKFLNRK